MVAETRFAEKTGETCRLVVTGPTSQVDVSVPVHVPLTDLMPALLRSLGTDLADRGLEHSGWVLQRLGEAPLDEDSTTEDLHLLDGDVVHLRPRSEQIPPLDFDDLVDGVATGIGARSGRWRPQTTRLACLVAILFWLGCSLLVPLGDPVPASGAVTAAGAALVLLAGVTVWSRVTGDHVAGRMLVVGAIAFAAEAGALAGQWITPDGRSPAALSLLAGALLALTVGVAALVCTADRGLFGPPAIGALGLAGAAVAAGLLSYPGGLSWLQVAAVLLVALIAVRAWIPLISFKLAGMTLPELPVEPDDLQKDIDPEDGKSLLDRTALADRYMTALHVVAGVVSGAALAWAATTPGRVPFLVVLIATLNQLLTLRPMTSAWQRLALGVPAALGLALALLVQAGVGPLSRVVSVLLVFLVLAMSAVIGAHSLPRRRMTPIWGRVGDWSQTLTVVMMIPFVLYLLGAFAAVRRVVG